MHTSHLTSIMEVVKLLLLTGLLPIIFANPYAEEVLNNYEIANKYICLRKINLFFDRPILFSYGETFLYSFPGTSKFSCDMTVTSRSKQTGVIATVQRLNFRMTNPTTCYDWIKFDRDSTLRCGNVKYGMRPLSDGSFPPPPKFVSMYSGPFLLGTSWAESSDMVSKMDVVHPDKNLITYFNIEARALQPGEKLEMMIAYTGFKECDADNVPRGWFNCGYGVCIMEKLLYDGVVNCPFGDCIDEGSCEDAILNFQKVAGVFNESTAVGTKSEMKSSRRTPPKKYDYDDNTSCSLSSLPSCNTTLEDVKDIKNEFEKHNVIFERVSSYIERALKKIEVKGSA
ncbi:hypothetical protein J437_LFUL008676 [Ladona fulva]|uniref:Uncharacterized protein n=1 Tax=Ladona fulva TaxID=123851 RepID=A0A8K0K6K4_LADFU|nr:hypothetical protein J437_LFUL008676 [Ladona fulva]